MPLDAWRGTGIVYFGNGWRAENRTSSHHIAAQLARRMPVLYIDSPGMRAPSASGRDLGKLFRMMGTIASKPVRVQDQLWHCTVPQIPYRRVPGVEWLNRAFGIRAVRRAMAGIPCEEWISWFVVPHPGFMAHRLGERLCVYYCIDDYAAHPGVDAEVVARLDEQLARAADQVFVAPPGIVAQKRAQNPTALYSPHGVDAELFARACDPATPVPEAAGRLRHPVVGFFGLVADWIDIELIAFMASARPDWSFLLVGHVFTDVATLKGLRNVVLAGAQPYESLPGWARAFDVAIIPYRDTVQTRHANPLKLREYLASGRPVVATPNPEVERFREWVRIARGGPEFLEQVAAALAAEPAGAAEARMAAVRSMTWGTRVEEVLAVVGERLQARNSGHAKRTVYEG